MCVLGFPKEWYVCHYLLYFICAHFDSEDLQLLSNVVFRNHCVNKSLKMQEVIQT